MQSGDFSRNQTRVQIHIGKHNQPRADPKSSLGSALVGIRYRSVSGGGVKPCNALMRFNGQKYPINSVNGTCATPNQLKSPRW